MLETRDRSVGHLIDTLEPGVFRDRLREAWALEAAGDLRTAAASYRTVLQSLPRFLSPSARPVLDHAKSVVDANDLALEAFLDERLAERRARLSNADLSRFDKCRDVLLRKRRVYRPSPSFMYVPELPAIEFYDRALFPWLDALEAATADIRAELLAVLADGPQALEPYVSVDGVPQDRWRELNKSRRWGVHYLWKAGAPVAENLARCPKTAKALEGWPQCDLLETGPSAVFSILDARTRIPPHVGVHNARLIVHLPLIVPPGCGFRVGAETRSWEPGKAFVFDDTIEHEAWNDSDQPRAVLILDTWNPFLSEAEREMVTALTAGVGEYYGELPESARGAGA
ncbi:MAG: aspartyl/asparaginyl beta-hydroxylase domain-containing protein [Pseudomonadota bacterium]